jgi:hypothetical protein
MSKNDTFIERLRMAPLMLAFWGMGTPAAYGILISTRAVADFGSSSIKTLSFLEELILRKSL